MIYYPISRFFAIKKNRRLQRLIDLGDSKITKAIDIQTILQQQSILKTLLRTKQSKTARTLLKIVRRETVLDLNDKKSQSSSDVSNDGP